MLVETWSELLKAFMELLTAAITLIAVIKSLESAKGANRKRRNR